MDDGVTGGRWQPQVAGGGGRANHPWLAAAEQGCSALPRDGYVVTRSRPYPRQPPPPAPRASAPRGSAIQPSAIGFGFPRLTPERPEPELLAPVPVTWHPIICPQLIIRSPVSL